MESKASIMDTVHPDLLQPPHYVGELIRFVAGEWQPNPSQQEQLVAHLTTCSYCRIALIELLLGEQEYEKRLNNHLIIMSLTEGSYQLPCADEFSIGINNTATDDTNDPCF